MADTDKLYPGIKAILKILWIDDDLIMPENLTKLQRAVVKFEDKYKKYAKYEEDLSIIREMAFKIYEADGEDCMGQVQLFELQEAVAEMAIEIAHDERQEPDLIKTFHWLFTAAFIS